MVIWGLLSNHELVNNVKILVETFVLIFNLNNLIIDLITILLWQLYLFLSHHLDSLFSNGRRLRCIPFRPIWYHHVRLLRGLLYLDLLECPNDDWLRPKLDFCCHELGFFGVFLLVLLNGLRFSNAISLLLNQGLRQLTELLCVLLIRILNVS